MTHIRLIVLPTDPDEPALSLTFDGSGRVLTRARLRPEQPLAPDGVRTVMAVSGLEVTAHSLVVAAQNPRQARAAAALMIEDRLAAPLADAHIALGAANSGGSRLAVVVAADTLRQWLSQASRLGVTPDVVTPDYALLPVPADDHLTSMALRPAELALRGADLAASVDPELFERMVAGRTCRMIEDPETREALLFEGARAPAVNLLQGAFGPAAGRPVGRKDLRLAAVLALALLVSPALLWSAQIVRGQLAMARDEKSIAELAERFAGTEASGAAPADRLRARLTSLEQRQAFPRAASALFMAVEATPGAAVANLYFGPDGRIRATVSHSSPAEMTAMTVQVDGLGFRLSEDASSTEDGRLMTDVILEEKR